MRRSEHRLLKCREHCLDVLRLDAGLLGQVCDQCRFAESVVDRLGGAGAASGQLSTLVNFEPAEGLFGGQSSFGANTDSQRKRPCEAGRNATQHAVGGRVGSHRACLRQQGVQQSFDVPRLAQSVVTSDPRQIVLSKQYETSCKFRFDHICFFKREILSVL